MPLDYAPPYRETARLETFLNQNGLTNVGAELHREMLEAGGQPRRIATMVAGNSGRPAGACGFEDGTIWKLHAGHTTQEEDVVSNWMTTACHNAKRPLASMADGGHDIANAVYQDTIYGKWGMLHPQASDKKTVQRVDYTRAHDPSSYGHAWVVGDAALSAKRTNSYGQRFYDVDVQYPTSLVFVAGPNCGARGHDARSTMTRTFNPHAEADYTLFRSGVQAALYAGLMAMARLGIEVALLAHVSAGIYAGPHRAMLHADFEAIVNELLEHPKMCNSPSGPVPLGRYFHKVILTLLE